MKLWPNQENMKVDEFLKFIIRERKNDVQEYTLLPTKFLTGRKVGKTPTASNDVVPLDRVNDFNWDDQYLYVLIDNAGTAEWRRASLGSW